ncbi:Anhydro-N-acetylmuramic acid kinase [Vibrio nigripulchritudo MADA3029]|uniref:anhydro-N-acetylmuramic acid kinase n=1 Tax=Vibrio nigripulchritudo TaxID=28173 RepID=UPI0003B1E34F|nr:anhydro-N-acetylmuramic acid kinase [Vibrio nigripulchritudo]CCN48001.1 Anhydro-N-acetylmuramic acid kinase [Vibrio nigripulchritudo MADA3020]CCN53127.1 Anhydro-N-acetylmuramic acid kinase [Vibrio nigripulchritudo MADA3021]CCN57895.1 Anhydro-N-acetylmuramic acid kinase [Vibrio nigripulchritudo MADA3029]
MANQNEYYIGVMSGTSLDGVDVALVEISESDITLIDSYVHPMPPELKQRVLSVCEGQTTSVKAIGELDHDLGKLFAKSVNTFIEAKELSSESIRAVGCHGQTLFHQPDTTPRFTMQLGDANLIAVETGIDTVADFRRKDMALGGQGAPLVPAFHRWLFSSGDSTAVILNIGGIANISVLHPTHPTVGYDTGPGNMLMDAWCFKHTHSPYDKDGQLARSGKVVPALLNQFLSDAYFELPSPKSTGRELFNLNWLGQFESVNHHTIEDVQATLLELTAASVAQEVEKHISGIAPTMLVCGGGAMNPVLMERLGTLLPDWTVADTKDRGIDSEFMEAMAFAWLAHRRIYGLPSNLPEVTGASKPASLGVIYPSN